MKGKETLSNEKEVKEELDEKKVDVIDDKKEIETKDIQDNSKDDKKEELKEDSEKKEKNTKKEKSSKGDEKELEEIKRSYAKKRKKRIIIALSISVVIIILLILSTIFAFLNLNNTNIINGVSIEGMDVSGLSKEEATFKLESNYTEKLSKEIEVKYEDYVTTINPTVIEASYKIEEAVNKAVDLGKDNNIFVSNFEIVKTMILKQNIDIEMTINEEIAKKTIEDLGTKLPGVVVESDYSIEDSNLLISKGQKGIKVDSDALLQMVKDDLNSIEINKEYLDIPVIQKEPEPIDIDKIHEEVFTEVQDAYYTKNPFEIHPEVEGVDFDVEAAKQIIADETKTEYVIPLIITKPKITISQIGTEAFPDLLATFTTKYDASNTDRTTNLRLACQKLNGKVILSGETFSYNKTLGERTVAAGYRNGKIYENGQVVDGIGGGICQISSTLYNTVLLANLDIVERRNHQFVTSYVSAGRDATVVYGLTDFKFKNTRKYPVRLVASVQNGVATVSMYGIKEAEEYTVTFETRTISTIPFATQYVEDSSLAAGAEKVKQSGANGLVTETYMTKTLNGKFISRKLLSKDTYSAMQKIVLIGSGASAPQETAPTPTPTPEPTPVPEPETPVTPEPETPGTDDNAQQTTSQ